jgi:hypothetical protein
MARGGRPGKKRTQYVRDAQGQFASTPGGGKKATPSAVRKAAKAAALKGGTLAARTSLKKSRAKLKSIDKADPTLQTSLSKRAQKGAVTRGSKNLTKTIKSSRTRLIGAKPNANTIKKKRPVSMAYILKNVTRSMSPDDAQRVLGKKPLAKRKISAPSKANTIKKKRSPILTAKPLQKPAAERPGSMTSILKNTLRTLAQADAQRIREIESITGQKIKPIKQRAAAIAAGDRVRSTAKGGKVADTLRAGLRELAQSDARAMREMSKIVKDATPKVAGAKRKDRVKGSAKSKTMTMAKMQSGPPGNPLGGKRSVKRLASMTTKGKTMKPPVTLKGLIRAGGNRWQKNQMDRVYFNNLGSRSGLDVDYYKSGNIYSAAVQGKGISNSRAREVVASLRDAKLFYDRQTRSMNLKMTRNPSVRLQQFRTAEKLAKQDMKKIEKSARMKTKRQRKTNSKKPG